MQFIAVPMGSEDDYQAAKYWRRYNIVGVDITPVESLEAELSDIEVFGNRIVINGAEGEPVSVYDMQGRCICRTVGTSQTSVTVETSGVYILRIADRVEKIYVGNSI